MIRKCIGQKVSKMLHLRISTRRMAIANGTCVSFCITRWHIIWLPHESHAGMSVPSAVAGAGIWLRQESLRHILASSGYAPGTIAVNVTWMERGFNAGQTHLSSTVYEL